jgi:TolB-like protein
VSLARVIPHAGITAQPVDAVAGHHLWAERYDRDPNDISGI